MTRDCSLHAIQAVLPDTASVIVGQYAPAAAHERTAFDPDIRPVLPPVCDVVPAAAAGRARTIDTTSDASLTRPPK